MNHESFAIKGAPVSFPEWRGERHYMLGFTLASGLPSAAKRYQAAVDQMMSSVSVATDQECFLMVDEKLVGPGKTHRRPGLHVDGYWRPVAHCHGGAPPTRPGHHPAPSPSPSPGHSPRGESAEAILMASNFAASVALLGAYQRDFEKDWRGGDCSDVDATTLTPVTLESGATYVLDVFSLHASMPVTENVRRTLLRINVPNWRLRN